MEKGKYKSRNSVLIAALLLEVVYMKWIRTTVSAYAGYALHDNALGPKNKQHLQGAFKVKRPFKAKH